MKVRNTAVRAQHEDEAVMLRLELVSETEAVDGKRSRLVDLHVSMSPKDARTFAAQLQQAADHVEPELLDLPLVSHG